MGKIVNVLINSQISRRLMHFPSPANINQSVLHFKKYFTVKN